MSNIGCSPLPAETPGIIERRFSDRDPGCHAGAAIENHGSPERGDPPANGGTVLDEVKGHDKGEEAIPFRKGMLHHRREKGCRLRSAPSIFTSISKHIEMCPIGPKRRMVGEFSLHKPGIGRLQQVWSIQGSKPRRRDYPTPLDNEDVD